MSSFDRGPMNGVIRQANRVVGAVCLSESSGGFVEQFNRLYGAMQMRAEGTVPPTKDSIPLPVRTGPNYRPPAAARHGRWGDHG
jgi:hypothetical protein